MILDEAHVIKNRNTRTFAAVTALREQFEGCLTLTGTPLDNTWEDGYALLSLLKGHPITSFKIFQKIFKENKRPLTLSWITSNSSCRGGEARRRVARPLRRNKKDDAAGCAHHIEAQQYAYHPMLVQLKVAHKGLTEYMRQEDTDDAPPSDTDAQALAQVSERCQLLEQGRNSLSRRVKVVLDTIRQHLDVRLDDSFTIADESVWFLDIVAIALMKVIIRSITIHTVANTTIPIPPHHQKDSTCSLQVLAFDVDDGGRNHGRSKQLDESIDEENRSQSSFMTSELRTVPLRSTRWRYKARRTRSTPVSFPPSLEIEALSMWHFTAWTGASGGLGARVCVNHKAHKKLAINMIRFRETKDNSGQVLVSYPKEGLNYDNFLKG
ncbi:SNF2, N-terminal [Fusarium oxysporum f. sp. vasinfectum]|nr:SNF2, N-terminal [Fusarium oxysporum f. sp. vasinfectum]